MSQADSHHRGEADHSSDVTPAAAASFTQTKWGWWTSVVRVVLAVGVTLTVLPFVGWRVAVVGGLLRQPEKRHIALLVLAWMSIVALLFRLVPPPGFRRGTRVKMCGLALCWMLLFGGLMGIASEWNSTTVLAAPLAGLATLLLPWSAWVFSLPWSRVGKIGITAATLLPTALFLGLYAADGVSGDGKLNLVWRSRNRGQRATPGPAAKREVPPSAADYPQFMGPDRTGVVPRVELDRDWKQHPPALIWRRAVGEGWGAFAVKDGYAYTQEQRGERECVVCYELLSGKERWVHADAGRFASSMGGAGPRATPTIVDDRVFTVGARGTLNCLTAQAGERIWTADLLHDAENLDHGLCASPLVVDSTVVACRLGLEGCGLAAFDAATGERLWAAGESRPSYASPSLVRVLGREQILLHNCSGVAAHAVATGELLWEFPWTNEHQVNASQPIVASSTSGEILASAGYGVGAALFRVRREDAGSWRTDTIWTNTRFNTKFMSPLLYEGHVYGLDNGILACLSLKSGQRIWKQGRYGHGQLLRAGDLLIVQTESGDVVLVEPSPQGLKELGRIGALRDKTWNHPALAFPFLLVRNHREAACFRLPGRAAPGA